MLPHPVRSADAPIASAPGRGLRLLLLFCGAALLGSCVDRTDPVAVDPSAAASTSLVTGQSNFSLPAATSGWSALQLRGSAAVSGGYLRLTDGTAAPPEFRTGAAWYNQRHVLRDGFTTTFRFRIHESGTTPGEGFAFLIRHASEGFFEPAASCGACLGYSGMPKSLAVEFDIKSSEPTEGGNHVAVHTGGTRPNRHLTTHRIGSTDLAGGLSVPLANGAVHTATIVYTPGNLQVFLNDLQGPVLTVAVNLATLGVLDSQGRGWIGFSAATGADYATHEIQSWSLNEVSAGAGAVMGTVTDEETGAPIAGAQVTLAGQGGGTLSDASGNYLLPNVPAGNYTLEVNAAGYEGFSGAISVVASAHTVRNVALAPVYEFSVLVRTITSTPVAGVLVTATDSATGEPKYELTDAQGVAKLQLKKGKYIFTARRVGTKEAAALQVWPRPASSLPLPAGLGAFIGAVYVGGADPGSVPLTAANFNLAFKSPFDLNAFSAREVTLILTRAAIIACTLLDADGNPLVGKSGQVFGVIPHGNSGLLPPLPSSFNGNRNLPRGLGYGFTNLQSNGSCELPASEGTSILELSNNGETYVLGAVVTNDDVNNGKRVRTVAGPHPVLVFTNYFTGEPWGDASGESDLGGVITYGYKAGTGEFVVSTGFRGLGTYTLEIFLEDPGQNPPPSANPLRARVVCTGKTCSMSSTAGLPPGSTGQGVSLVEDGVTQGSIVWQIPLPGNPSVVWFRVVTSGSSGTVDRTEIIRVERTPGDGNSYVIMGAS